MTKLYYVYEHWRPDTDLCFYVGKGHGGRANDMRRGRNRYHKFITAKLSKEGGSVEVKIVASGLTEEEAFSIEIERIRFWRSEKIDLANLTDGGEGASGYKFSEERKIAAGNKSRGRRLSEEAKKKISLSAMGNQRGLGTKKTKEAIERSAAACRGRVVSAETRKKISDAKKANPRVGYKMHPDHIEKVRLAHLGCKRSEETRAKMRKPKTAEHRAKLSAVNLGKSHSEETRKKLSANMKVIWAKRKSNHCIEKV